MTGLAALTSAERPDLLEDRSERASLICRRSLETAPVEII